MEHECLFNDTCVQLSPFGDALREGRCGSEVTVLGEDDSFSVSL